MIDLILSILNQFFHESTEVRRLAISSLNLLIAHLSTTEHAIIVSKYEPRIVQIPLD